MFSDRLRMYRKQFKYSQEQIARKLNVTQGAVSQWEKGLTYPEASQLLVLADIFGVSIDDLFGRDKRQDESDIAFAIRERLRRDPSYRLLFDAADTATPEHLRAAAAMLKSLEPPDPQEVEN